MTLNQKRIALFEEDLNKAFDIQRLQIEDESHLHAGHVGAASGGGHFKVTIVTPQFEGLTEEQQQTLASYAQIQKGGVVTIQGQDIGGLSPEKVKEVLSNIQGSGSELENNTTKNVESIQRNLSATESVILANNQLTNAFTMATLKAGNFSEGLEQYTGVISKAQLKITEMVGEGYTKASEVLSKATAQSPGDTLIGKINTYMDSAAKERFVQVQGNPVISVNVTGLDVGLSDVIKTHIANEISKAVTVSVKMPDGAYSVGN
jgi:BolA protein